MSQMPDPGQFAADVDDIWFDDFYQDRTSMFAFFVDEFAKIAYLADSNPSEAISRAVELTGLISSCPVMTEHEQRILINIARPIWLYCQRSDLKSSWMEKFLESSHANLETKRRKVIETSVYFLLSDDETLVKIGFSKNVLRRTNELSIGSPVKLQVIKEIPGGVKKEAELHRQFAHLRQHGEWFLYTPELKNFIAKL